MMRALTGIAVLAAISGPLAAQDVAAVAGKRVVFLGDSITQSGGYVTFGPGSARPATLPPTGPGAPSHHPADRSRRPRA